MRLHSFGRTDFTVSDIGFGAWQIGGSWGEVSEADGDDAPAGSDRDRRGAIFAAGEIRLHDAGGAEVRIE